MQIKVDLDRCVGGGQCVVAAEDIFDQRDVDGVVILLNENPPDTAIDRVKLAVKLCPAQAIQVES